MQYAHFTGAELLLVIVIGAAVSLVRWLVEVVANIGREQRDV
jgi:uncharacterized membrane protein